MSRIAIITDSTAYLPQEYIDQLSIYVAPQVLIWGDDTYEDGVDIYPNEFLHSFENRKSDAINSQVTPATFNKFFAELVVQDKQILAVLISNYLSGTIASAIQAKDNFPGATIEIVDSYTTSMALGFQVLTVARAAAQVPPWRNVNLWPKKRAIMSAWYLPWIHLNSCIAAGESAAPAGSWVLP